MSTHSEVPLDTLSLPQVRPLLHDVVYWLRDVRRRVQNVLQSPHDIVYSSQDVLRRLQDVVR